MPKNIIEKIWNAHVIEEKKGFPTILGVDLHLLHEVTSAQAFSLLRQQKLPVLNPASCLATIDHSIPTRPDRHLIHDLQAKNQIETLRRNARQFKIPLFDTGSGNQGVIHVIAPELGAIYPGLVVVCGDSHTATHGAFGALAFGIGTTEVAHVLATNSLLQTKPKTLHIKFSGLLKKGVSAKDLILALIAKIGIGGATKHIIEYTGEVISNFNMEERLTLCNMSIEAGARAGLIAPDQTTYNYLKDKSFAPKKTAWDKAVKYWESLKSDPGCIYDQTISFSVNKVEPMITWGTNPEQAIPISGKIPYLKDLPKTHQLVAKKALDYVQLKEGQKISGVKIDYAFLGSCTNGRLEDLKIAAQILKGKKVAKNVIFYVVPGSEKVKSQAEKIGLDKIFIEAGAFWRLPGCSLCLSMNDDRVPPGKRCISSSNRNFVGRQGVGSITHLASPETVARSAIAGHIT